MSNWAAYKEKEIGLPVVKRAKHGIHFDAGKGLVQAEFVGKPCHYFDGKEYKAIDTRPLLRKDGSYGCPHSDVIIHTDGTVQVGDYTQRAALIYPGKISVDGDRIARPFSGGVQYLYITENGFRQEIVLDKMPDLKKVSALVDTVKGILPTKYTASALSLKDSSTAELSDFVQVDSKSLASVLEAAKYPVVIDPDFEEDTTANYFRSIYSTATDWATRRTTSNGTSDNLSVGQLYSAPTTYRLQRLFMRFDTSSIGESSTVTQVNQKGRYTKYIDAGHDFTVEIVKHDWDSSAATIDSETKYDACLAGTADSSDFVSTGDYANNANFTSGNLDTTYISKTGYTAYSYRADYDYSNTGADSVQYYVRFANAYSVLSVLYTVAGTFIPVNFNGQMQALSAGMRG